GKVLRELAREEERDPRRRRAYAEPAQDVRPHQAVGRDRERRDDDCEDEDAAVELAEVDGVASPELPEPEREKDDERERDEPDRQTDGARPGEATNDVRSSHSSQ